LYGVDWVSSHSKENYISGEKQILQTLGNPVTVKPDLKYYVFPTELIIYNSMPQTFVL
jgi:hypothetical protein